MTLGQQSPGKDLRVRYLWLGLAMMGGLLLLAGRLYRLQVTRGDEFAQKSVANFVKEVRIPADRGMILDRNGSILVDSRPSFNVYITPAFCEQCFENVIPKLSAWLAWDTYALTRAENLLKEARRTAPFRPVPVDIDLTRDELDTLHAHERELHGVDVQAVPHRNYRYGTLMGHVLGYMNEIGSRELERAKERGRDYGLGDYVGRQGIERALEDDLRGNDGIRREVVDARGRTLPNLNSLLEQDREVPPAPGSNVVLTIDQRLQEETERVFPGQAGAVIVMELNTGFILSLLSKPSYDPNLLTGRITPQQLQALEKDPLEPMINRSTQEHYSPGSVFKVVTALAALRSGQFDVHTTINCPGGYRLGARTWRCHKDSGHGPKNIFGAMQTSCDTYFYKVADTLGLDPIAEVGKGLGLGSKTGIGLFPEEPGIMPSVAYHDRVNRKTGGYTKGMALNAAIGQGDDNTTPLQIVQLYAAIANGGKVFRPQVVQRVVSADGKVLKESQPELMRDVHISEEHRKVLIQSLSDVVNVPGGTAYSKRLKDVHVAGKTGTAQVRRLGKVRLKTHEMSYFERDHAWFAAFAPVENPEIAIVVLNEHGGHGGSDAAPTAMAVISKYFELKKLDAEAAQAKKLGLPPPTQALPEAPRVVVPGVGNGSGAVVTAGTPEAAAPSPPAAAAPAAREPRDGGTAEDAASDEPELPPMPAEPLPGPEESAAPEPAEPEVSAASPGNEPAPDADPGMALRDTVSPLSQGAGLHFGTGGMGGTRTAVPAEAAQPDAGIPAPTTPRPPPNGGGSGTVAPAVSRTAAAAKPTSKAAPRKAAPEKAQKKPAGGR